MMIKTTPQELIKMDMNKKIITNIVLPALDSVQYIFKSYKVQPRAQNAKAYVNAAFLVKLSSNKHIVNEATLCFGGIHPSVNCFTFSSLVRKSQGCFHSTILSVYACSRDREGPRGKISVPE